MGTARGDAEESDIDRLENWYGTITLVDRMERSVRLDCADRSDDGSGTARYR